MEIRRVSEVRNFACRKSYESTLALVPETDPLHGKEEGSSSETIPVSYW